jgi:hypothetical protein
VCNAEKLGIDSGGKTTLILLLYLNDSSIVQPEKMSVQLPETIQVQCVDGDMSGHFRLMISPSLR